MLCDLVARARGYCAREGAPPEIRPDHLRWKTERGQDGRAIDVYRDLLRLAACGELPRGAKAGSPPAGSSIHQVDGQPRDGAPRAALPRGACGRAIDYAADRSPAGMLGLAAIDEKPRQGLRA